MPEYLVTIWAWAGAKLSKAHENAVTTAAVIRMVSSPRSNAPRYVLPNGRRPVTDLSINQSKRRGARNQNAALAIKATRRPQSKAPRAPQTQKRPVQAPGVLRI